MSVESLEGKKSQGLDAPGATKNLIVGLNAAGEIIFFNEGCEEVTGYGEEEAVGRFFWDLSPEPVREEVEGLFSDAQIEDLPPSYEVPWITEDGRERLINWEFIQFRESGDIQTIIGVGVDTTERERAEQRLSEFEQIYDKLIAESMIGIYVIQPTSEGLVLRFANAKLGEMFGYEEGDLGNRRFGDLVHPKDVPVVEKNIQQVRKEKEKSTFQMRGRRKNGEKFWVENRFVPISYEGEPALLGMVQDITSRKRAEEKRSNSEEKYRTIVDFVKVGIGIIQNGEIVYLNDRIAETFECSKEELQELGFTHFIHPEDKEKAEAALREETPREDLPFSTSYRAITKEGKVKYLSLHAAEIEYEGSPATQLIIEDMTEQKETERRLRDQSKELRQAYKYIREAERKLGRKTEELKKANEMRAEFMDLLAHELRSHLTPVETYVEAVELGELGDVTSTQREKLSEAEKKLKKIDRLMEDTLDLSRMEADKVKMSEESIYLPDMMDGIIEDLGTELESKNHRLYTNVPEDFSVIEGDPRLLDKVFRNLVSNAIQYTPEGGEITIDLTEEEGDVHVRVSDTGVGISEENQEKIFQKFYRVEEELNAEARGLGIGLAISKHFVELHGGEIWVESEEGEGSTFHVKLPKPNRSQGS